MIDPAGLQTDRHAVHVELAGARTRGQTVVDRRTWSGDLEHDEHAPSPAVVDVERHVDGTRWRQLWLDTVLRA